VSTLLSSPEPMAVGFSSSLIEGSLEVLQHGIILPWRHLHRGLGVSHIAECARRPTLLFSRHLQLGAISPPRQLLIRPPWVGPLGLDTEDVRRSSVTLVEEGVEPSFESSAFANVRRGRENSETERVGVGEVVGGGGELSG